MLLLGGALALYRTLGRGAAPGLAVEPTPAPAATASPEQAGPEEEATAEEPQAEESAAAAVPDFTIYTDEGDAVQLSRLCGAAGDRQFLGQLVRPLPERNARF